MTVDIDPKRDYVAIWFKGGTGGKFLSAWLTSAKTKNSKFYLSDIGSANDSERELEHDFERPVSTAKHLEYLKTARPRVLTGAPYFYTTSIMNPSILATQVNKLIILSYDLDDVDLIFKLYVNKNNLFSLNFSTEQLNDTYTAIVNVYFRLIAVTNTQDNILSVSFKDMLYADYESLSKKLSDFVGIEQSNFSKNMLLEWRAKSFEGLERIRPGLEEFLKNRPAVQ